MSVEGKPPRRSGAKRRKKENWGQRITSDSDLLRAARFLKIIFLSVVTMTAAFCLVGVGAYVIALVIHQIFGGLEARHIKLPPWVHASEVQSVGIVLLLLLILATLIALKDLWRVGVRGEQEDNEH